MRESVSTEVPTWFSEAVATPYEIREIEVDGAVVRSRCWGQPGRGIVLVHGSAAHAGWWDHIAPLLAQNWRVVAIDLSGHGSSSWRSEGYQMATWSKELIDQAGPAGIVGPPYVVGHSQGGYIAMLAGVEFPNQLAGVITIDTYLPPSVGLARYTPSPVAPTRYYQTREEAIERFKLLPPDPYILPYALRHVVDQSLAHDQPGWFWKYDPNSRRIDRMITDEVVVRTHDQLALLRGEFGIMGELPDGDITVAGRQVPTVCLPQTGHHAILDDPLAVVREVERILALWEGAAN
ncbi:MAG: alpha/beta hydrolase [bacterium]|nr:alpha/beta hydrolase [bacterium]